MNLIFRKATKSMNAGQCVEVALTEDGTVAVRDSKDPLAATLKFTADEWSAFINGAKGGEFDLSTLGVTWTSVPEGT